MIIIKKILGLFLLLFIVGFILNSCSSENKELKRKALNYFTEKYNIKEKDVKVEKNDLRDKDKRCFDSCNDNYLYIKYDNKEYIIEHDPYENTFGDNYQYDTVYSDFIKYLNDKFPFAQTIEIDLLEYDMLGSPLKYSGDIKSYIRSINNSEADVRDTWVKVWIKAEDETIAKELYSKYALVVVNELEELNVSFDLTFASEYGVGAATPFYDFHVFNSQFFLKDMVDNHSYSCRRRTFDGVKCH